MDNLNERVEFFLSAQDLISKDFNSKSDPFIVVYAKRNNEKFIEIGRTEVIQNNHFPKFQKRFILDYYFEEKQTLKFDLYDEDKRNSKNLKDHELIGSCSMILGEIVHSQGQVMAKKIMKKGNTFRNKKTKMYATIRVRLEKLRQGKNADLTLTFSATKLAKMDFFGKSDPYLEIYRTNSEMSPTLVHRTEVIKNAVNCEWKPLHITSSKLCNNDENRKILIRCLDWDDDSSSDLIGEFETTLIGLSNESTIYKLINPIKPKKKKLGFVQCKKYEESRRHTFLDFMAGGLEMSLMIAIDYTGSNGHPLHPQSLHYQGYGTGSQYQQAIRSVGGVLSAYDSDQKYPVWGFGAKINDKVSHDFALNGNVNNPEVYGIDGVELIYRKSLTNPNLKLFGPTLFAPILAKSIKIAQIAHQNNLKIKNTDFNLQYYVLLILTDGVINDMPETKNAIVFIANSYLPLSIIIVGVGKADFTQMRQLDADNVRLKDNNGNLSQRDIVQFVSMKECTSFSDLSSRTLKEIPKQYLSYANKYKFLPGEKQINTSLTQQFICNDFNESKLQLLGNKPSNLNLDNNLPDMPLPRGWTMEYDENGDPYYVNHNNQQTQWEHPLLGTTNVNTTSTTMVNSNTIKSNQNTQISNQFGTTNMQQTQVMSNNNNINNINQNMNQMNNQMINNMMQMNNQMMNNMNQMNQNFNQMNQQFSNMNMNMNMNQQQFNNNNNNNNNNSNNQENNQQQF